MRYLAPLITLVCAAQTPPQPDEIQHIRFMLLNIASLDHDPRAIKSFEDGLVKLFGLSSQESGAIHAAAQPLKPLLAQNRQSAKAIVAGKSTLSQADIAALLDLDSQREQKISDLADEILSSVSPSTAARLRNGGKNLAAGAKKN